MQVQPARDLRKEVIDVATGKEVDNAIARVGSGNASTREIELARKAAKQAGSRGNAARTALKGR